jgi:hypothetical protein
LVSGVGFCQAATEEEKSTRIVVASGMGESAVHKRKGGGELGQILRPRQPMVAIRDETERDGVARHMLDKPKRMAPRDIRVRHALQDMGRRP